MTGISKPTAQTKTEIHTGRIERAVDVVAKSAPQHRAKSKENPKKKKPRGSGAKTA